MRISREIVDSIWEDIQRQKAERNKLTIAEREAKLACEIEQAKLRDLERGIKPNENVMSPEELKAWMETKKEVKGYNF